MGIIERATFFGIQRNHLLRSLVSTAHKKGSGSTKNGRDSLSKRRGIKVFGNQNVSAGSIIVRQVGSKFHAGVNVRCRKDFTLFSLAEGIVKFERLRGRNAVSVYNSTEASDNITSPNNKTSRRERKLARYNSRKTELEQSLDHH